MKGLFDLAAIISSLESLHSGVAAYFQCTISGSMASQCYATHDALVVGWFLCIVFIVYSFVWSIVGNNCSKVDQIWSIVPVLYCWHFFAHYYKVHGAIHHRLLLLCVLVTLWGVRLTFNFWRKGGYGTFFTHEEDYRWPIIREKMHPVVFLIFNLSFIATYQNVLLFWIAVPAFEVMRGSTNLGMQDMVLAAMFSLLLLMETVADEQHWVFQSAKHSIPAAERANLADKELRQGFFQSGLFKYSRHPNYFAEQSMWVCMYLFSVPFSTVAPAVAAGTPGWRALWDVMNWTGLGCVQLMLLFQGSMSFGEAITLSKYPTYRDYQKITSMCIPMIPGKAQPAASSTKKSS